MCKKKSGSVDEVVDELVRKYGRPVAYGGNQDEPFLAPSPLYWPARDYLLSHKKGEKRKASSEPAGPSKTKKQKK